MNNGLKNILILLALPFLFFACAEEYTSTSSDTTKIKEPPVVSEILPAQGYYGDTITILGTKFETYINGYSFVLFDSVYKATIISWTDNSIKVIVPEGSHFGIISIKIQNQDTISSKYDFTILQPELPEIQLVEVSAGTFKMGDLSSTGFESELPVRNITISKTFLMSKYEITQAQWKAMMTNNPSTYKSDNYPVYGISWIEAVYFCNYISEKLGFEKCYQIDGVNTKCDFSANGFRLPTEAEWEYAARAGTQTNYYNGDSESGLPQIAWYYSSVDSLEHPKTIGGKAPNAFGLYDITGNIAEFCWDWWSLEYNPSDTIDPKGASTGAGHILRGGAWITSASFCRTSFRNYYLGTFERDFYTGFRVVRNKQ
jgi:formylglycine-generating enzyme